MSKFLIFGFIAYAFWAMNQGKQRLAKWSFMGAGCTLALMMMRAWREAYLENLSQ
ncbi:MAG: hypothetical protein AAF773_24825 [Cyanobacteria bacterium P01_D01_bin.115]